MTVGNFFQDYPYLTLTKSAHGKLQSLPEKGANIHCSWTEWHGRQLLEMRLRRIKQKMRSCKHQDPPNPTPTRYSPTPELLLPVTNAPRRPLRPSILYGPNTSPPSFLNTVTFLRITMLLPYSSSSPSPSSPSSSSPSSSSFRSSSSPPFLHLSRRAPPRVSPGFAHEKESSPNRRKVLFSVCCNVTFIIP